MKSKNIIKYLLLALVAALALSLTACRNDEPDEDIIAPLTPVTTPAGETTDNNQPADEEPDIFDVDRTGDATQWIEDILRDQTPVTITYSNWNIAEPMEMMMVEEFMQRFPWITVEIMHGDGSHMENLQAWSMAGQLPDVFAVSQVPPMVATGFLRDIQPYGQQFDDWAYVPRVSLEAATFRNRVFAMPFATHYQGMVVNDDLWDANNLPRLEIGFSAEQLLNDLRTIVDIPNGIGGISSWITFARGWMPAYFDNSLWGPHTWDGERLNLNHPAYAQAINFVHTLREEGLVTDPGWLSPEQWESYNAGWHFDVFNRGDMAVLFEGSWWIGTWTNMYRDGMNVRFVGLPGGTVALTPTYAGISSTSQNPAAAMLFLHWMAFGEEGIAHRIYLRDNHDIPMGMMPATVNPRILEAYFAGEIPGIEEAMFRNMHNAVIEGEAILPGHVMALFNGNTGMTVTVGGEAVENATVGQVANSAQEGFTNWADVADAINTFANTQVQLMIEEINFMLDAMGIHE